MNTRAKTRAKKYAFGGDPIVTPIKKRVILSDKQLEDFSNFSGSTDTGVINKYLDNYGLKGSQYLRQPYTGNITNRNTVTNSQQDWIGSTTSRAMGNAMRLGIAPEAFGANKELIYGNDKYGDTVLNNKDFSTMYPNYMDVAGKIYSDRYRNYKPKPDKEIASLIPKMATGGQVWGDLAKQAPGILDSIMGLLDNQSYSRQPIVNASTVRNMATPYNNYAMGGSIDDLSEEELASLQQMADEQGISIEEAFAQSQQEGDGYMDGSEQSDPGADGMDNNIDDMLGGDTGEYAYGGKMKIKLNPAHKGWCTPMTKSTCTGKRRQFAINAKKWKHAMGGVSHNNIEVEGGEALETPDGSMHEVKGAKHEQGGVDVNVPDGTKIFSDRLKIEGKSMKARKLAREKRLGKMEELINKDPNNRLLKNTVARSKEGIDMEDKQDMILQKIASKIYAPPQVQTRDDPKDGNKYPYGGDMYDERAARQFEIDNGLLPYHPLFNPDPMGDHTNPATFPNRTNTSLSPLGPPPELPSGSNSNNKIGFTTGDYVGMAGTAFGSIAPIINTMNNRRATLPNINRFKGFGHDAIDANTAAQDYIAGLRSSDLMDISTSANSAYTRNSNSASGINTERALNAVTDVQTAKARTGANNSFSKAMMGLLGQRGQLTNIRDYREMAGQTQVDTENKADTDNYYSNMGHDLENLATGVQSTGRNLNISHSNQVDANLISQLSKHGLEFDKDGNIVNKR